MSKLFSPVEGLSECAAPPIELSAKNTRACQSCGLVKTFEQFLESGCENCMNIPMVDDRASVSDNTTQQYSGLISIHDQSSSWAAKWLRKRNYKPGCYALDVSGS